MDQLNSQIKPFDISKWEIKEAWEEVRANKGAPGVDGQSIADFEKDLKNNLYRVWNRMSSGSYFPPPVRAVAIPKPHGDGERILGIPAVSDRVAQTVVVRHLMRRVEPVFHPDSFGYRPGRSALDAVEKCRERCWKRDWVVEFDIAKFFDSVPWDRSCPLSWCWGSTAGSARAFARGALPRVSTAPSTGSGPPRNSR
ncbi:MULTISPECIES: reverse transcriptase domain-containing protein [unclassified Streptomyces]|uniref:reverse transcriptase domain-containing protein n=1 Tax=unclassified Streptomyces TaxID=2593676 RepID=UPI001EFD96AE|nr:MULTISPECIES: reverse transcriptase domain-containing protein [unclassified Streptomyces]